MASSVIEAARGYALFVDSQIRESRQRTHVSDLVVGDVQIRQIRESRQRTDVIDPIVAEVQVRQIREICQHADI